MKPPLLFAIVAVVALSTFAALSAWIYQTSFAPMQDSIAAEATVARIDDGTRHPIFIEGQPTTPTALADLATDGSPPTEVSCTTCHSTRTPQRSHNESDQLDAFHQGLQKQHGSLSCLSCHNADNYDTLRLADGTAVPFENTMQLCAQCHGPQYRDYQHGSHGGMTGYWDRSRGPRTRNSCTVCHDAHSPAYPDLLPVFFPKDVELRNKANPPAHADTH